MDPKADRRQPSRPGVEQARRRRLEALAKGAVSFNSSLDLTHTLAKLLYQARHILQFQAAVALLLDESGGGLQVAAISYASRTRKPACSEGSTIRVGRATTAPIVRLTAPVYLHGEELPGIVHSLLVPEGGTASGTMLVPLVIDDTWQGLIMLSGEPDRKAGPPGEFEFQLAGLLGSQGAAAVRNALSARSMNIQLFETVARGKREWEQTFDAISDPIFMSNMDHFLARANKAFVSIFGKHPREIIGKRCYELVWGAKQPCAQCPSQNMRLRRYKDAGPVSLECVIQGKASLLTAYPIIHPNGRLSAIVHVVKDLTEQNRMQELIIRAEKLRAVGEMASGIAHDFNNTLASIIGWNEILLLSDLSPRLKECVAAIHQAAVDGTETVKRIQEYTRIRKDTAFSSVDLNDIVRGAVDLARPRWKDWAERAGISISISTEFAAIPPARGNGPDLREVFLNVLLNAIDALPQGGEIIIRTGQQGDRVFAAIEDTGVGMSEDVMRRVFDPFFTTKDSGGSGLGLSVAYGIISRHGGELTLESAPNKGSMFTVLLPTAPETAPEPEPQVKRTARKLRILLIDDDLRVLEAIGAMLRSEGHEVAVSPGGRQGLIEFSQRPYELVITDLGMPEINGWEVASRVKAVSPDIPVLFITGWAAEIASEHLPEMGIDGIIQKPCRLNALREAIDLAMSRKPSSPGYEIQARGPDGPTQPLDVLVIEDNLGFGRALKARLEIDGHQVTLAASGHQGLLCFEQDGFDLILTDQKLPDISGIEIAAKIKQMAQSPVVALMTGDVVLLDQQLLQEDCLDAILRKPWKETELDRVIRLALQRRAQAT